ncbi:transcriptional regulator GlxA family with amidase domain [Rhodoligotrophos appendicifer]|uniref:GlxA family transcriptional regulator n=1 Tax=Rhodoligotrophos appendicifer TaxID=987056 RepID=UPI001184D0FB|nr:GlxA family transcriptional regulator [Rhodoligotrophos appendicifer]
MFGSPSRDLPQRFAFVLLPEFSMMPVTSAIEPLRLANRAAERQLYDWSMFSVDGQPVAASNGIVITAVGNLEAIGEHATVVVCGGIDIQKHTDRRVINWIRKAARRGMDIGALCTASHVLAEAGILSGHRCTIHWENLPGFSEAFPDLDVTGSLFEIDRDRFSSAGGTSAIDMMLALIGKQHGPDLAAEVAENILHSPIRHQSEHQRMSLPARIGARHPKLVSIIDQMEQNLEEPLSPSILARQAGLSTRQLERLFRRYLERSPKRYYLELRLRKARSLLLQTDMSVINVALACGFSSPSHFSKCYRAFFSRTPYRERGLPSMDPTLPEVAAE